MAKHSSGSGSLSRGKSGENGRGITNTDTPKAPLVHGGKMTTLPPTQPKPMVPLDDRRAGIKQMK